LEKFKTVQLKTTPGDFFMKLPADTFVWKYGRKIGSLFFRKKFGITHEGQVPEPPFVLVSNHVSYWDPFFLACPIKHPTAWVAARGHFESSLLAPLIKATGAIPKRKARPDVETIKGIFHVLRQGGVVGLFPEGSISWTGQTGDYFPGTDKLLDRANVPILAVRIKGAWLKKPRWADRARKGRVHLELKTFEGSKALDFIDYSEWEWQKQEKNIFPGTRRAEGITRVLWFCSKCGAFEKFTVQGNDAECSDCGEIWHVDECGYVNGLDGVQLYNEQLELLQKYLEGNNSIQALNAKGELKNTRGNGKREKFSRDITLTEETFSVGEKVFPVSKIRGQATFMKKGLEFSFGDYWVQLKIPYASLLLSSSLEILKKEN